METARNISELYQAFIAYRNAPDPFKQTTKPQVAVSE